MAILCKQTLHQLPGALMPAYTFPVTDASHILHFGVGAFHRAHQAWIWHQLQQSDPERFGRWSVTGVCLLPADKPLVDALRAQDLLYTLRASAASGEAQLHVINSLSAVLYGDADREQILDGIAHAETKVISFTITEGGYDTRQSLAEIDGRMVPSAVFAYLAHGLARRKAAGNGGVVLMSCDNIQENGRVLKEALATCLERLDPDLKRWVEDHVLFPNSMVDRITPATTTRHMDAYEQQYGLRDKAMVVSEDFLQWVLEDTVRPFLPPIDAFGVEFVADVRPYELMKLSILNAGHSLVGFLGDALGYTTIHDAVVDERIGGLFDKYALREAIPVLGHFAGMDYTRYYQAVKLRFSNALINDSTARIIGGSSDKIPKFLLPIVWQQLRKPRPQLDVAVLMVALWWRFLQKAYGGAMWDQLVDTKKDQLGPLFADETTSAARFLAFEPVFGKLGTQPAFAERYFSCVDALRNDATDGLIQFILRGDLND